MNQVESNLADYEWNELIIHEYFVYALTRYAWRLPPSTHNQMFNLPAHDSLHSGYRNGTSGPPTHEPG
jgi:hypothetical protein